MRASRLDDMLPAARRAGACAATRVRTQAVRNFTQRPERVRLTATLFGAAMKPVHHVVMLVGAIALCTVPCYSNAQQVINTTLLSNAIHLDTGQVKAGSVRFDVHNAADNNLVHELVVLKTTLADNALPVRNGQVPEQKFRKMGEVEDVSPGASKRLTIKLTPGRYVLVCNKPGHYSMGMHSSLIVTP